MKLTEENLKKMVHTKNGSYRKGSNYYYIKVCEECGEKFLGQKNQQFCDRECKRTNKIVSEKIKDGLRKAWNEENSKWNSKEYRNKLSNRLKNQWNDKNSRFNSDDYRNKRSVSQRKLWDDEKYRQMQTNSHKGFEVSKETKDKISASHIKKKGGYNKNNIPTYDIYAHQIDWVEEVRRNASDPNILEVKCAYCGRWFVPKRNNVRNRVDALKGQKEGEYRFYCSNGCKQECPVYRKHVDTLMKEDAIRAGRLNWIELNREVQPELRQMVLKRDGYTCQKCGSTEHLHCHHILPASIEPIESADVDNCTTYCKECHKEAHKRDGCKYGQLRNCIE